MSKLYDTYMSLKTKEKDCDKVLYLFKSGIFFICIDEDAKIAARILNLKITNLNADIVKCGFPVVSLDKYSHILNLTDYSFQIIDISKKTSQSISVYSSSEKTTELLQTICNIDTDNLSIKEAYSFIDNIKSTAISIIKGEEKHAN